ncbi:hypothetical protein B0H13DRAFT_1853409 [Mycena leptocephala]|nr:hypothetical protein B0H13DRAFT_1853409 [Mycena leptocephala]
MATPNQMRWSQDGDCRRTHELLRDDELQARIVLSAGEKHRNVLPASIPGHVSLGVRMVEKWCKKYDGGAIASGCLNFFPLINVSHPSMPGAVKARKWPNSVCRILDHSSFANTLHQENLKLLHRPRETKTDAIDTISKVRLLMEELRPLMGQVRRMSVQARQIKPKRKKPRRKRTRVPKTVQVRQDEVQDPRHLLRDLNATS